jgi:hypothetical protein
MKAVEYSPAEREEQHTLSNKTLSAPIRHIDVRFCFSPHLSLWRSTQKRKHLVSYRLWYSTVQTGLLGAVCSHVTARQTFNYKWEAAGWGGKYMFMCSYDSPEGHRGQLTYTFVVRIISMSLTKVSIFSICCWPAALGIISLWPMGLPMYSWLVTRKSAFFLIAVFLDPSPIPIPTRNHWQGSKPRSL